MKPAGPALALVAASWCAGCGARSDLGSTAPSGSASDLPCGGAAPGAKVWSSDQALDGPLAVDGAGTTYFRAAGDPGQGAASYAIAALDSCGALRWQSAPRPSGFIAGALRDIVVDGDRVLFLWGTVDAFDRGTGAHLWNVDLGAYAGEDLAQDPFAEIGPLAVSADGTAFLTMTYSSHAVVLSIDAAGTLQMVAQVTGDMGDISGFLLDADDHLDTLYNSTAGHIVTSYTRDGSQVFSSPFACDVGFLGSLAAGSSFVVMQSGPCAMDLTGADLFSPPSGGPADAVTIDTANDLYVVAGNAISSLDATGASRWTTSGSDIIASAPLLATGGQIFTVQLPASIVSTPGPVSIVTHDTATGAELARYTTDAMMPTGTGWSLPALITPAGQIVFQTIGTVTAIAVGQTPDPSAQWPTGAGGPDRRNAALGH
jgi:hypothetical protein